MAKGGVPCGRLWEHKVSSVDVVIHSVWRVDFNHSLEASQGTSVRALCPSKGSHCRIDMFYESGLTSEQSFVVHCLPEYGWTR